jgi:hypothetical protein
MTSSKRPLAYITAALLLWSLPTARANILIWTNSVSGNWATAANWSPNQTPTATNTVIITNAGTYTVTISAAASVSNILVGAPGVPGTVTLSVTEPLTLGGDATFATNTIFGLSDVVRTAGGTIQIGGRMNWASGSIIGPGRTIVAGSGTLSFNGYNTTKTLSTNILENYGTLTYSGDAGFGPGLLPNLAGGAHVTNHVGGTLLIGANHGYNYSGTQPLRSWLVNYGTITCGGSATTPGRISVELLNHGTLSGGFCYIDRGTNFGTLDFRSTLAELSFLGDEATGEYFTFEPGTTLTGPRHNINAAGLVVWNAPATVQNGELTVGAASGGYSSAGARFITGTGYTNTYQVTVLRGEFQVPTNGVADLRRLEDTVSSGSWTYLINNLGVIRADTVIHTARNFDNRGLLIIRTNLVLAGGAFYGTTPGTVVITNTGAATFTGSTIDNQSIHNSAAVLVDTATTFTDSVFVNRPGAFLNLAAGALQTGPSSVLNFGTVQGYGTISVATTNAGLVLADDSLGRTLTISSLVQTNGETRVRRGVLGGNINIAGGYISATNSISGTLRNNAVFGPGTPFGLLTITGNYTNEAGAVHHMPIKGTLALRDFPQVRVSGTAKLAGTLNVTFTNGFFPVIGSSYTALTYTARSGAFDQILTPNYDFEIAYYPNALVLRASNALPNLVVSAPATQLVCVPFLLNASATDLDGTITNITFLRGATEIASVNAASGAARVLYDFPGAVTFEVRATDDRGGQKTITTNVTYVTLPLHTINLGGFFETNAAFKLCMLGEEGSNYVVQAAEVFSNPVVTNWNDLGTMTWSNGIFLYRDQYATNFPMRFYRARREP